MNRFQKAFDGIRAEEELRENCLGVLTDTIQGKPRPRRSVRYIRRRYLRYGFAAACLAVMLFLGLFSYRLYITPSGYIGMDVNPSVELGINQFERVIRTRAFNAEGDQLLSSLSLQNKNLREATVMILDEIEHSGQLCKDSLLSVTVQADDPNRERALLAEIMLNVNTHVEGYPQKAEVDVFSVDGDTLALSHAANISAAKYAAILALQAYDPSVTIDSCRDHSVSEIHQMIQQHQHQNDQDSPAESHGGQGHRNHHRYGYVPDTAVDNDAADTSSVAVPENKEPDSTCSCGRHRKGRMEG